MPRKIVLVIKSSPYGSLVVAEGFRMATAMVAMDILPKLLFMDDGVHCLLKNQRPGAAGLHSNYDRLKTLADLVGLYALRDSMVKRNLKIVEFDESFNVELLSKDEVAKLIVESKTVMAF